MNEGTQDNYVPGIVVLGICHCRDSHYFSFSIIYGFRQLYPLAACCTIMSLIIYRKFYTGSPELSPFNATFQKSHPTIEHRRRMTDLTDGVGGCYFVISPIRHFKICTMAVWIRFLTSGSRDLETPTFNRLCISDLYQPSYYCSVVTIGKLWRIAGHTRRSVALSDSG